MTDLASQATGESDPGLWVLLQEDWEAHGRRLLHPGFHALAVHRVGVWARQQGWLVRKVVGAVYLFVNGVVIRNVYRVEISRTTTIGRRLRIGHHQAVVIGDTTVIGDDCLVRQGVTLGRSNDEGRLDDQPVIGNGVELGAGATIIGPVRIGDGARIGPGAIVTRSVPAGATAFAAPARIIRPFAPSE